jgi:XTP/dITP diphosphohydrolase
MSKLIVATSNPGKLQEMEAYLQGLNWELALKPKELEVEETGATFMENAILKASCVAKTMGEWAIADDSGLMVAALNGAPGIYSARYGNCGSDAERNLKLLAELGDNPNRQAQFVCAVAIADPQGTIALKTEGICPGEILTKPTGNGGFGYDPIFYVPQLGQTFAQMKPEIKNKISHRGKAFQALLPQLKNLASSRK